MQIKVTDESATGQILHELTLSLASERATVRDLIRERVVAEVAAFNQQGPAHFNGLIQPTDSERTLNGFKVRHKQIDPEKQVAAALDAFLRNGYSMIVDNRQAESLDEEIILNADTTVSFIKLVPLVGG